jgi:hypothetical protein
LDHGYDLTFIERRSHTGTIEFEDGRKIEAMSIIDDLNVCMAWVSYPGPTSSTAAPEDIDFAALGATAATS